MDSRLLKSLMVQLTYDIKDFLSSNLFSPLGLSIRMNGRDLSEAEARATIASGIAENLLFRPPKDCFLTARQHAACELLFYLGSFLSNKATDLELKQPNAINNLRASIKRYLNHLTDDEAKAFIPLLETDSEQPNTPTNENDSRESLENSLVKLANNTADAIRCDNTPVTLNGVCKELTKTSVRNKNRDLLWGQKGWHEKSWLKSEGKLKGWKDPILKK